MDSLGETRFSKREVAPHAKELIYRLFLREVRPLPGPAECCSNPALLNLSTL